MRPTDLLAVWTGKAVLAALQRIGRKGNALPGLVVEKAFPNFLPRALATLSEGVVVVSGTNGKTTTTKMVATVLGRHHRVLTNDSGSNFVRGVITTVVEATDWRGRLPADVAVLELDEAWAVRFVAQVKPRRVLLLNVMRDQLDRFGEIDTTARLLRTVALATTHDVVLNRDDPRIAAIAAALVGPDAPTVTFFGVASTLRGDFPTDEELYDDDVVPDRDAEVPPDVVPARAELRALSTPDHPPITLRLDGTDHDVVLHAEGTHNAQNAAGAAALALTAGLDAAQVMAGLAEVEPAFGRGQAFTIHGRHVVLHLVKNPAGFRQSLRALDHADPAAVVIAINDADADGRDVSWLWDVDFRALGKFPGAAIVTSGTRAADMALRLAYDDVDADTVDADLDGAVLRAIDAASNGSQVIVFATYTAMWALHPRMEKWGGDGVKLVHLYPREMNLYGDTGNVLVLRRRLEWRGLPVEIVPVRQGDPIPDDVDVLLGGGGQDAAQGDIGADFVARGLSCAELADAGVVMLAICGSYQLLGHRFVTHEGRDIPGVGILDVETFGSSTRLIGNIVVESPGFGRLVGYENHSGLTRLGPGAEPLGRTAASRGNNGEDRTEGAVRGNVVGTYLHGPLLAKSPHLADELLRRALVRRGELDAGDTLSALDDSRARRAAEVAVTRPR